MTSKSVEDIEDLTSLFDEFYDSKKISDGNLEVGEIVSLPVLEQQKKLLIADVNRVDSHAHREVTFNIRNQINEDFSGKENRTPIKLLSLDENHELVLSKAKYRHCIIVGRSSGVDGNKLPDGVQKNKALNAFHESYYLAPIYSTSTPNKTTSFGPVITARIKCMMYPQFLFLPVTGLTIQVPSIARFDQLFVSSLIHDATRNSIFLGTQVIAILQEQIKIILGNSSSEDFDDIRELMLSCLPDEYKEQD